MNSGDDWTRDAVLQRLRGLRTPGQRGKDWSLRSVAAVTYSFDPATLQPAAPLAVAREEAMAELLADCSPVEGSEGSQRYTLRPDERRSALAALGNREAMLAALRANPTDPEDLFGRTLNGYVRGEAIPPVRQSLEELCATIDVVSLLEGIIDGLPGRRELHRALDYRRMVRWLQDLVGPDFAGRQRELEVLREYLGLPPPSLLGKVRQSLDLLWDQRRTLTIHGPGGIGKTSLVAKFILDGLTDPAEPLAFAYLSLDRPLVAVDQPWTLLAEIVSQLGGELEAVPDASLPAAIVEFGMALDRIGLRNRPFLVVLDDVEEVQLRGQTPLLADLLESLHSEVPGLRPVLIGRAPLTGFVAQQMSLSQLDPEAADSFLQRRGIADAELRRAVFKSTGGSPLSLSLAADLAEREGEPALSGLRRSYFPVASDTATQAALLERILGYIRDEDVRRIAQAAMVLRQVTPELIVNVLAPVCGLGVTDLEKARALFEGLGHEVSLVVPAGGGVLRCRADVRHMILALLGRDRPAMVRDMHSAAARYYAGRVDPEARAEELYHLLCLDTEAAVLESHWRPGAGLYLSTSIDELPSQARSWLEAKLRMP